MTFVVTDACVRCRYTDCVEVCPVDAFHAGEFMLVIDPDACIDCGVCEPECPVDAILPDSEDTASGKWEKINGHYARIWPLITAREAPAADHAAFVDETGKFERFVCEAP